MNKSICISGVVLGTLLVVFAALWVVAADHAGGTVDASQRLRLERVVSQLDGCATCHDSSQTAGTGQVALVVAPEPYRYLAYATDAVQHEHTYTPVVPQFSDTVRAEMLNIGQRILDLPVTDSEQVDAVTADYLAVYDAAVDAESAGDLRRTLEALDALEQRVRTLEHQANPIKLATATSDQTPDSMDALLTVPQAPLPAAWAGHAVAMVMVTGPAERVTGRELPSAAWLMPDNVQRRGPPAAFDNLLDSFV